MEFLRDELVRLLDNYEAQSTHYINKDQILLDILKSIDDNKLCEKNVCIACGIDLGISNPRQLCGKNICYNEDLENPFKID